MSTVAGMAHPLRLPSSPARAAARTLTAAAAVVGVSISALTWRAGPGLGWFATDIVLLVALAVASRRRLTAATWGLGLASLWLAAATCWYASDWALATALPGSFATLAAFALSATRRIHAEDLHAVGRAAFDATMALPGAVADAASLAARAFDADARVRARAVTRGALMGVPLAGFFGLLLSADADFRAAVRGIARTSGDAASFAVWTGLTVVGVFVAHRVLERASATDRGSPLVESAPWPYRTPGDDAPRTVEGPLVPPLTWGIALLHVVAVFALYVAASARSLFAGHALLRAHGTVTYAAYVHAGFVQVSIATLLGATCVVAGHVILRPRRALGGPAPARESDGAVGRDDAPPGPLAGKRALAAIELALLALLGVTLASCAHRLALYEEAYGYTQLRLGVWWLQLGVAGLVAITAARSVVPTWRARAWAAGLAWSGVVFVTMVGSFDADGWIAARNVARARAGAPLDAAYLGSLSEDAAGSLDAMTSLGPAAGEDREMLEAVWSAAAAREGASGWRSRRGLGALPRRKD